MPRYSLSVPTIAATSAHAFATLHTGANVPASIIEMGLTTNGIPISISGMAIGVPGNTPVATTSTLGLAEDPAKPASTVNIDTVWSTAPTVPTNFYRRMVQTNAGVSNGSGIIWTFPGGLIVPVSSWIVLWNQSGNTAGILDFYAVWDE